MIWLAFKWILKGGNDTKNVLYYLFGFEIWHHFPTTPPPPKKTESFVWKRSILYHFIFFKNKLISKKHTFKLIFFFFFWKVKVTFRFISNFRYYTFVIWKTPKHLFVSLTNPIWSVGLCFLLTTIVFACYLVRQSELNLLSAGTDYNKTAYAFPCYSQQGSVNCREK